MHWEQMGLNDTHIEWILNSMIYLGNSHQNSSVVEPGNTGRGWYKDKK